ncbi:hypothetical protein JOD54_003143 [Actinokineospora baliensis]|uniref:hypothetical protein n=1 Tax=Actinokineospora baliensis TaxID=547056 RepID=UPI0027DB8DEB|nr:hypothetical protein [Actinokineospora baliensis]MBM7772939.1 hypothetical protein [Actinokineospora baliensis]
MKWEDLPRPIQDIAEQHVGVVVEALEVDGGSASDVATVVRGAGGERAFVKAVAGISRRMRWLRNEIAGSGAAVGVAPEVLFHADLTATEVGEDWLVVGFEFVPGRSASLAPGSPDLPVVAEVVERIAGLGAGGMRPLRDRWAPTDWWERVAGVAPEVVADVDVEEMSRLSAEVPAMVEGDRLLHTDLHGDQFVIGAGGDVRVVDWGFPGAGARWVDTAFMILRLIEAGHGPENAEGWARARGTFVGVDERVLTAWAAYVAGLWTHIAVSGQGSSRRAGLARDYVSWRLARRS